MRRVTPDSSASSFWVKWDCFQMVFRTKKQKKVCKLKNNVYFCTPFQVINKRGLVMENVFAQRLINARRIRGISQRELCARLEGRISSNAIAKYETGKMLPSSQNLILESTISSGRSLSVLITIASNSANGQASPSKKRRPSKSASRC